MKTLISACIVATLSLTVSCAKADSQTSGKSITIAFDSDAGCSPQESEVEAGKISILAKNEGKSSGELEVLEGDRVIEEVENILPGGEKEFSVTLEEGEYVLYCGKKQAEKGSLIVTSAK